MTTWHGQGVCPVCGWNKRLTKAGVLRAHPDHREADSRYTRCPGSGERPVPPPPLIHHLGPWQSQPVPSTWCVIACEQGCFQTWTVDTAEFDPPLTGAQVEALLTPDLLAHEAEHHADT